MLYTLLNTNFYTLQFKANIATSGKTNEIFNDRRFYPTGLKI